MTTRKELRARADEVQKQMDHRAHRPHNAPSATPAPGMQRYTAESIFGGVWGRPGLDLRYRMLGSLALLTSLQRLPQLRSYVYTALNLKIPPEEVQEVLIQCSLFVGFPTTMNSLEVAQDVFRERGLATPSGDVPEASLDELERRGRALRDRLMGDIDRGPHLQAVNALAPDLHHLLLQYGFGELFHRPGLGLKERVLCSIAALTALRMDPPLRYFIKAGQRVGFSRQEVIEIIIQMAPYAGYPAAFQALAVAQQYLDGSS